MKKLLILIILLSSISLYSQEKKPTTYYFIRHADKVLKASVQNPELTKKGKKRAIFWSEVFDHVKFDMVFSTNFKRTVATAAPNAKRKGLKIQLYDPKNGLSKDFLEKTKGKTVLIVGHSNTIPGYVNKIINKKKYLDISESNYSNLYIVTISNQESNNILLKIPFQN
ncbi:histidine phosphatase family protein [Lutibacter sp.]|uniref:histidine phosphatase family protein n=1 Tax=Lutibacter sp. TaxID=1925666 RepID=UPI001A22FE92|nr:histidine phosphatase family protein [Lutibacter sp.]MBI9042437.1 histidine phosphatase family protein [Lutibacter sp.]